MPTPSRCGSSVDRTFAGPAVAVTADRRGAPAALQEKTLPVAPPPLEFGGIERTGGEMRAAYPAKEGRRRVQVCDPGEEPFARRPHPRPLGGWAPPPMTARREWLRSGGSPVHGGLPGAALPDGEAAMAGRSQFVSVGVKRRNRAVAIHRASVLISGCASRTPTRRRATMEQEVRHLLENRRAMAVACGASGCSPPRQAPDCDRRSASMSMIPAVESIDAKTGRPSNRKSS
jgi:hypothetical protein